MICKYTRLTITVGQLISDSLSVGLETIALHYAAPSGSFSALYLLSSEPMRLFSGMIFERIYNNYILQIFVVWNLPLPFVI